MNDLLIIDLFISLVTTKVYLKSLFRYFIVRIYKYINSLVVKNYTFRKITLQSKMMRKTFWEWPCNYTKAYFLFLSPRYWNSSLLFYFLYDVYCLVCIYNILALTMVQSYQVFVVFYSMSNCYKIFQVNTYILFQPRSFSTGFKPLWNIMEFMIAGTYHRGNSSSFVYGIHLIVMLGDCQFFCF